MIIGQGQHPHLLVDNLGNGFERFHASITELVQIGAQIFQPGFDWRALSGFMQSQPVTALYQILINPDQGGYQGKITGQNLGITQGVLKQGMFRNRQTQRQTVQREFKAKPVILIACAQTLL